MRQLNVNCVAIDIQTNFLLSSIRWHTVSKKWDNMWKWWSSLSSIRKVNKTAVSFYTLNFISIHCFKQFHIILRNTFGPSNKLGNFTMGKENDKTPSRTEHEKLFSPSQWSKRLGPDEVIQNLMLYELILTIKKLLVAICA